MLGEMTVNEVKNYRKILGRAAWNEISARTRCALPVTQPFMIDVRWITGRGDR
jgi:hypothetical protein